MQNENKCPLKPPHHGSFCPSDPPPSGLRPLGRGHGYQVEVPPCDDVDSYGHYDVPVGTTEIGPSVLAVCVPHRTMAYGAGGGSHRPSAAPAGNNAFYGCVELTSITLPAGLETIGTA